jgi:hypothetical protein
MNYKIRKLLDKKKLTGKEFGKAYIITQLHARNNNELILNEPILTNEEMKILAKKVTDQSEIDICNAYIHSYNWLDRSHLIVEKYYQMFYFGFSRLYIKFHSTMESEEQLHNLEKMTASVDKTDDNYQTLRNFTKNNSLNMSIFTQIKDEEVLEAMRKARSMANIGLANILSYNRTVSLFTNFFKIPKILQVFRIETEQLFTAINMLNDRIVLVKKSLYGSRGEITEKLKILDDFYPIINIQDFEPTEKAIKIASSYLKENILEHCPYKTIETLLRRNNE